MNQIAKLKATLHRRSKSDSSAGKIIFKPYESPLECDEEYMDDDEVLHYMNSITARQSEPQMKTSPKLTKLQRLGKEMAVTNEDWRKFKSDTRDCCDSIKISLPTITSAPEDPNLTENPKFKFCAPDSDDKITKHAYENHFADSYIKAFSDIPDRDQSSNGNESLDPFGHVPFKEVLIFSQSSDDFVQKRNSSWTTFESDNNKDDNFATVSARHEDICPDNSGQSTPKLKFSERGFMGQMRQSLRRKSSQRKANSKYETLSNEAAFHDEKDFCHSVPNSPTTKRWSIKRN